MRSSRLYISLPLNVGQSIQLDEDSAHYLRTVLRLRESTELILFNGQSGEYCAVLEEVSRKTVRVKILHWLPREAESPLNIHFGLGISRGDRMDWAVQKAVELGVNAITPLDTARCNVVLKADKESQKIQHWQKIIQHACEQSGRCIVPPLNPVASLEIWLTKQQGLKVFLDPYATQTLNQLQPEQNLVTLLSGPEGGFTEAERNMAKQAGFIPVSLGKRILRTETAALAALAAVQMLWGDFTKP
jgi:16S rRNA (uracil1498-N3)-methyltransferase